jgi:rhodanese-related sulfurtransferase
MRRPHRIQETHSCGDQQIEIMTQDNRLFIRDNVHPDTGLFKRSQGVLAVGRTNVTIIRPVDAKGALSVQLRDLECKLSELPQDRKIVAYCRGPYCILAVEAVEMLRTRGFKAFRLEYGIPDLQEKGFPVVANPHHS